MEWNAQKKSEYEDNIFERPKYKSIFLLRVVKSIILT